jgi:nucleotide-binding universal stress UspA family protein
MEGDSMNARKIVVPLDGSALAEAALPKAIEIAKTTPGARIALVRAAEASAFVGDAVEAQVRVVRAAEDYLEEVAARVRTAGVTVTASVWYGAAAASIVEMAEFAQADLIVMTTHGRTGFGRLVMGSVAEAVLRATHTPVLLLRPPTMPVVKPAVRGDRNREVSHV